MKKKINTNKTYMKDYFKYKAGRRLEWKKQHVNKY
jgi:hypothetical protein